MKPIRGGKRTWRGLVRALMLCQSDRQCCATQPRATFASHAIKRGDVPDLLDGAFVDALRAREADGVIAKPQQQFKPGQSVSITHGPLANLIGEVLEMRDKERILILLKLMGQEVKTLISAETLVTIRSSDLRGDAMIEVRMPS